MCDTCTVRPRARAIVFHAPTAFRFVFGIGGVLREGVFYLLKINWWVSCVLLCYILYTKSSCCVVLFSLGLQITMTRLVIMGFWLLIHWSVWWLKDKCFLGKLQKQQL